MNEDKTSTSKSAGTGVKGADRRKFLGLFSLITGLGAIGVSAIATISEIILSPLRKRSGQPANLVYVAHVEALPEDGTPMLFKVFKETQDAWTRYGTRSVGNVYLKRTEGGTKVVAWNARCPHAGCSVSFRHKNKDFFCGCHNSRFTENGELPGESTYAPRPMDSLKAEIRNGNEIWVEFMNFQVGTKNKTAIS